MHEILRLVDECRLEVNRQVSGRIDDVVLGEFLATVFPDLDELSTHTTVEQVHVHQHSVERIDSEKIEIHGHGTVYVDLQYGSGSDMRRGDGVNSSESYDFTFVYTADLDDPTKIELVEENIEIDTSSFWDDYQ